MTTMGGEALECPEATMTIAFASGTLPSGDRARVEAHLVRCADCRATLAVYMRCVEADETAKEAQVLDGLESSTVAAAQALVESEAVRARQARLPQQLPSVRAYPRYYGAIAAAILVMLAIAGAFILYGSVGDRNGLRQHERALRAALGDVRPTEFRLTGFDYAPVEPSRGADTSIRRRIEAAAESLRDDVARDPTPEARHAFGQALVASADYAGAIEQFTDALAARPNDAALLTDRAVALASAGEAGAALADLDRALAVEPDRREAVFNRALIHQYAERKAEAHDDWSRYLRLDESSPWADEARRRLALVAGS